MNFNPRNPLPSTAAENLKSEQKLIVDKDLMNNSIVKQTQSSIKESTGGAADSQTYSQFSFQGNSQAT